MAAVGCHFWFRIEYYTNCNNKILLFYNGKCRWFKYIEQCIEDKIGL
jgi:hypothetical protein